MAYKQNDVETYHEQEITLLGLLQVLVRRKKLIVTVCAVTMILSVWYSLTLSNVYSATTKILPPQKEGDSGVSSLLSGLAGFALGGFGGGSDLYLAVLKSRSLNDAVVQRLRLDKRYKVKTPEDARAVLAQAVKFQAGKDGVITIIAEDRDPRYSALLANTVVDELAKATVRLNLSKAGTERVFLEKRLELVKADLRKAEEELKAYSQSNQIVKVETQAGVAIAAIARMKSEVSIKEVQLAGLRATQTEQNPEVQALQASIRRLKADLALQAGRNGTNDAIPSVGAVPGVGLEYARRLRDFKTQEAVFEQLTKQYELAKLKESRSSASLQILDEAVVPSRKCAPSRSLIVIFATMAAFVGTAFYVFLQEYLAGMPEQEKKMLHSIWKSAWSFK